MRADIIIDGEVDIDTVAVEAVRRGDNLEGRGIVLTKSETALAVYYMLEKDGLDMATAASHLGVTERTLYRFGARSSHVGQPKEETGKLPQGTLRLWQGTRDTGRHQHLFM